MNFLKKRVFVAGTFDNFHVGHQFFLWTAREMGESLTVIIARDVNVLNFKKKSSQNNEIKRKERVKKEFANDNLVKIRLGNTDNNFLKTIAEENPDILVLGFDQFFDEKKCSRAFPNLKIIRVSEYSPTIFKSSKF
jgi:cytidyltransferase-like protein